MSITLTAGHHSIGYAYPHSDMAKALGRAKQGAWYVQTERETKPAGSYPAALAMAADMGTTPDRWSVDHPLNAKHAPEVAA